MEVIKNNKSARVTPYGVYIKINEPEQIYNGKQFPLYGWEETMATIELKSKEKVIYIFLVQILKLKSLNEIRSTISSGLLY